MDIAGLIEDLHQRQMFGQLINNPMAQFGLQPRNYLGAELLPERLVETNDYTEEGISYRTLVANDGTRYSPVQKKAGVLTGSMLVRLGYQDIGSEFKANEYDALIRLLRNATGTAGANGAGISPPMMAAETQLLNWATRTLNLPLREVVERQRWEAIVDAQVIRTGDNGYTETVNFPNPVGHRVAAGGTWSNSSYDPYAGDIIPMVEMLRAKGYTVSRIVCATPVTSILAVNTKMLNRMSGVAVQSNSVVTQNPGRLTLASLGALYQRDALPAVETYDLQYRTSTGSGRFLKSTVMVFFCTTGRDEAIDRADAEPLIINDTLGYAAIGVAAGQADPGRVVNVNPFTTSKPPRVEGEAWQASLPVVTEPEAVAVITGIA